MDVPEEVIYISHVRSLDLNKSGLVQPLKNAIRGLGSFSPCTIILRMTDTPQASSSNFSYKERGRKRGRTI